MGIISGVTKNIQGMTSIVGGMIGGRARRREQRQAQQQMNKMMGEYDQLDTSNLAANMQNTAEDLTVNLQQANFQNTNQERSYGDAMEKASIAAGGSGIAAMTQAIVNQRSRDLGQISGNIGQQESANQRMAANQAAANQSASIRGAEKARGLQYDKTETQLGMSQQRFAAANAARAKATDQIVSGVGNAVAGAVEVVGGVMTGGLGSLAEEAGLDK